MLKIPERLFIAINLRLKFKLIRTYPYRNLASLQEGYSKVFTDLTKCIKNASWHVTSNPTI